VEGGLRVAVVIGFGGIGLIAKPAVHIMVDLASIVVLGAAFCVAFVDMALRNLGRTENALTLVFYFLAGGVVLCNLFNLWRPPAAGKMWSP